MEVKDKRFKLEVACNMEDSRKISIQKFDGM